MIWQHESPEEQQRVLMDLEVMTSQHSPYIVEYYGSAIINVSALIITRCTPPPSLPLSTISLTHLPSLPLLSE